MRSLCGLLAAGILLTGCSRDGARLAPADRQFIETIVALRQAAEQSGGEPASYAALKAGVLRDHDVTEEQLRAYLDMRARDLTRLAAVWESINVRLTAPTPQPE
ncbi:MAG TPA: hypothetical protein VMN60_14855 [Longimicrobiales bacterium]|nr:hypothetical protein [Longimicrobiales bacterium]